MGLQLVTLSYVLLFQLAPVGRNRIAKLQLVSVPLHPSPVPPDLGPKMKPRGCRSQCHLDIHCIDEDMVSRFLENHLPQCACARPVHRTRNNLRAALRHLLVVLRDEAVIAEPIWGTTPIDEELRRFDDHMNHVRGLAPATRSMYLCTVRRLLLEQFGSRPVVLSAIMPEDVRRFVASQCELYSTPGSAGSLVSALRGYFRFRITCGDQMHALISVVPYPANWQLASLPKALSSAEVGCLVDSLGWDGPSALLQKNWRARILCCATWFLLFFHKRNCCQSRFYIRAIALVELLDLRVGNGS